MKKKITSIVTYLIFFGVGVGLVAWSLGSIPNEKWGEFKHSLASANYGLMGPVFLILVSSHILRSIRWRTLVKPLGYETRLTNVFFSIMIGYLANLAVPRSGEILKCTLLSKYDGVPVEKLLGTIVLERAIDITCLLILFGLAFLAQYSIVSQYASNLYQKAMLSGKAASGAQGLLVVVLIVVSLFLLGKILFSKFQDIPMIRTVQKIFKGVGDGLATIKYMEEKWIFTLCTAGIWALYIIGTWVGLKAMPGTNGMGIEVAVSGLAFASIGMIFTPGGIGAYPFFMAKVLERNGVPFEVGYANGTLQWFAQFIIIVVMGFVSLAALPFYNKTRK